MRKRNLTREERARRRLRIVYLIWAVFTVTVLLCAIFDIEEPQAEPETTPQVVAVTPEPTHEPPVAPVVLDVVQPVQEESPVRDDVPLDAETQLLLYQVCDEAGVQHELALAVIWRETNFKNIVGDDGDSVGYMQVQQRWHSDRMNRLGVTDLADPYGNFLVGCDYLAEMLEKDRGIEWALHSYNGGPTYANKMAKAEKVSQYVNDVLNYMNNLGGI